MQHFSCFDYTNSVCRMLTIQVRIVFYVFRNFSAVINVTLTHTKDEELIRLLHAIFQL